MLVQSAQQSCLLCLVYQLLHDGHACGYTAAAVLAHKDMLYCLCTARLPVSRSPDDVYRHVDADVTLTVLTHKIIKAVRLQGVAQARLLLRDWLVIFAANYHRNMNLRATAEQLLHQPVRPGA